MKNAVINTFACLAAVCLINACTGKPRQQTSTPPAEKELLPVDVPKNDSVNVMNGITVKDSFDYSKEFLRSLVSSGVNHAQLIDDKIIVDGATYDFPSHLKVFRMNAFFGSEGDLNIKLLLERINQSTITYSLLAGHHHDLKVIHEGGAELTGDFFLRQLTETNELTGNTFPVVEYVDDEDNCLTSIRIGKEEDSKLMARITQTCDGRPVKLAADQPILLIEK